MPRTCSLFQNYTIAISAHPQPLQYSWSYLVSPSKRSDYSVINSANSCSISGSSCRLLISQAQVQFQEGPWRVSGRQFGTWLVLSLFLLTIIAQFIIILISSWHTICQFTLQYKGTWSTPTPTICTITLLYIHWHQRIGIGRHPSAYLIL